jgi:hypothetical protein
MKLSQLIRSKVAPSKDPKQMHDKSRAESNEMPEVWRLFLDGEDAPTIAINTGKTIQRVNQEIHHYSRIFAGRDREKFCDRIAKARQQQANQQQQQENEQ